jgi:hypothetical protein
MPGGCSLLLGYDSVCFVFRLYYAAGKRGMGGREREREREGERWGKKG